MTLALAEPPPWYWLSLFGLTVPLAIAGLILLFGFQSKRPATVARQNLGFGIVVVSICFLLLGAVAVLVALVLNAYAGDVIG
jgi:hypothetical protein